MPALPDVSASRPAHAGPQFRLLLIAAACGATIAFATVEALILLAAALGFAAVLRDFRVGVVLIALIMPLSRSHLFPHAMFGITGLNPLNVVMLGTLAACLMQLPAGGLRRFAPTPLLWLYIAPIAVAGALGSRHVGEIAPLYRIRGYIEFDTVAGYLVEMVAKPMMFVAFGLLVGAAAARSRRPERLLLPALLSVWIMALVVIVFVLQSGIGLEALAAGTSREFLSELGVHANDLGRLFAFAFAILLFTWAEARGPALRMALLVSMGLAFAALILTFSRAGFLSLGVALVLFVLWRPGLRTVLGALAIAAIILVLPAVVFDRAETGFGEGLNAISAGRIDGLWLPLLPEFLNSPVFGNGLGSILWSGVMRSGDSTAVLGATTPHSAYFQALLDMGVVGFALLCAYLVHAWKGMRACADNAALSPLLRGFFHGALAGFAGLLVAGFAGSSLTPTVEQIYLWFAIGMMYGLRPGSQMRGSSA